MQDTEIIQEFLIESAENLARLDLEMVELERKPDDAKLLGSIFRTVHTIKGTCGFLGYPRLEALAHAAENILNDLRNAKRIIDAPLTTLILESVDAFKRILGAIEAQGDEGPVFERELLGRLHAESGRGPVASVAPAAPVPISEAARPSPEPPAAPSPGPPTPADSGDPAAAARGPAAADTTLRVDLGLLDRLMNLVGELVLTRNQVLQYGARREDSGLNAISQRFNLITTELQEGVMKTRMQPIRIIWNKLPRLVRDLANTLGKQITLEVEGAETELDRAVIEAIKDPLTHVVRNCCDHGIESPERRLAAGKSASGRINMRAYHEGGQVNIEIEDDGGGINPDRLRAKAVERGILTIEQSQRLNEREALNLVFLPGLSTAAAVTNISGRGVGMDVLRTNIERINGVIDLSSVPGRGTTVRIRIPLTLAIIPGLIVTAGGERFVIPQLSLHELVRLEAEAASRLIEHIHTTPVLRRREALLPLVNLSDVLHLPPAPPGEEVSIVIVRVDERRFGLIVDAISDTQEIVVKPLGQQIKSLNCYAGATIMGDGKVSLILDVAGIGLRAGVLADASRSGHPTHTPDDQKLSEAQSHSLLLFRAGQHQRLAMSLAQVARLEKIPCSQIESAAGSPVVQYRDRVLPIVSLTELFGGITDPASEHLNVIVYGHGERALGIVVDEILDIVDGVVDGLRATDRTGLLGSAVIGGKMTDFLDVQAVAEMALPRGADDSMERLRAALALEDAHPQEQVRS